MISEQAKQKSFLSNAGEAGQLIKAINWSESSIGPFDQWSNSLCTTLGLMLHSAFPMFLFWGKDLICFYNDAYRPSLGGDGKHPAIGKKGEDVWPETWAFIQPIIHQVMTSGNAVYYEDQLIPIFRNGKMEDVFWTFSYSPAYGDSGEIAGVFVVCTETTKTVQSIRQLGESEERFRTMAENTDVLIALSDETSNATYFNKSWEGFTGRSQQELINFGWADLVHIDDRQRFLDLYLAAFNKREAWTCEFRMLNRDGEYRWLLANGPARFRPDGTFAGYISSSIDITDRKNAEKHALEGEHRIRAIIENAPFPIGVYVGKQMRIEFANKSIKDVWGKGDDVIGRLYSELLPELQDQKIFSQLDQVYTTGVPFHARNQKVDLVIEGNLKPYYFNYSFTPLYDTSGNVYGVMNTAADLTDLYLAKQKVEQSERNLRNMVLQAPVAMCILLGSNHVIEVANDLMIELWGKPKDAVMNKPVFDALPDARGQGLESMMADVFKTGKTFTASEMPVNLLRKGKTDTVYQNFVYEPYRDSDGTILGVLAITIDVTAQVLSRQKIEEIVAARTRELEVANRDLEKSNSELAQFAYIASHDLQEPLRKIRTFSQMLERNIENPSPQSVNYLNKINSASGRMQMLVRDVLTYSEVDRKHDVFEPVDLNEIVQHVKADYELLIDQKEAIITADKLPTIEAIPLQMSQLFGNLLGNALKFSRKDIKPVISISCKKIEPVNRENVVMTPYYQIRITDNGIGFKSEFAARIFNIFQRLHRKSEFDGTGIGLAICKKIVLNHRGEINAADSSENGAVFNIILPAKQKIAT